MKIFAGIDAGSAYSKVVLLDERGNVLAMALEATGINFRLAAQKSLQKALSIAGAESSDIAYTVATGYGRNHCVADKVVTEISCHGKAGFSYALSACTVIDIGGQDTKIIHMDDSGNLDNFQMNRKCAAGTGAFLDEMARRLGFDRSEINEYASRSSETSPISSFCTVFAMTEVLKRIADGASTESLARGVYLSMVSRTLEMATLSGRVVASGGVASPHSTFIDLLSQECGLPIEVLPNAQFSGALGATILALENENTGES